MRTEPRDQFRPSVTDKDPYRPSLSSAFNRDSKNARNQHADAVQEVLTMLHQSLARDQPKTYAKLKSPVKYSDKYAERYDKYADPARKAPAYATPSKQHLSVITNKYLDRQPEPAYPTYNMQDNRR
jgi:uncharacterized HAD superfamily protein